MPFRHLLIQFQLGKQTILNISEEGSECRGLAGLVRDTVEKRQDSKAAQGLKQEQEAAAATPRLERQSSDGVT